MPDATPARLDPFVETILVHLTQIFLTSTNRDPAAARETAIRTLEGFNCQGSDEYLLAATVIAFSHQALDTFSLSTAPGTSASQAKQAQAVAASLCREATNAKKRLAERQAARRSRPAPPQAEPVAKPPRVTWTAAYEDTNRPRRLAAYRKATAQ